ncbi:MAG TPA: FxLYD domain-containing protein, partial [Nitrososphaeraceae archaeon]
MNLKVWFASTVLTFVLFVCVMELESANLAFGQFFENSDTNVTDTNTNSSYTGAEIALLSQKLKKSSFGYRHLIGEVKNLGYETADFVKVSVTIYNTDGGVIGTDRTYARPSTLSAGQKSTFDIFGRADDFKGMDHYELSLEWKNPDRSQGYVENAQIYKANTTESEVNGASIAQVKIPKGSSVEAGGNFEPATLKIGKGSTVKWINDDDALHTVTSGTPNGNKSGTIFDSGYLSSDNTYKHTFEKTGTFKYYDTLHTYMR